MQQDSRTPSTGLADPPSNCNRRLFLGGTAVAAAGAVVSLGGAGGEAWAQSGGVSTAAQFRAIQQHEDAHVLFLVEALGQYARPEPTFKGLVQSSRGAFLKLSRTFENTGVGAYLGALPVIYNRAYIAAAGSIALIEGRHAGYLDNLLGSILTTNVFGQPQSFERPLTIKEVVKLVSPFIASLNGGPPLTFSPTPSPHNDIAILNFALALEYLEATFYNINVPRFF